MRILEASGLVKDRVPDVANSGRSLTTPPVLPLHWPADVESALGLDKLPVTSRFGDDGCALEDLLVIVIKAILYYGAQRYRNLRKLTLNDLKPFSGGLEVVIRDGKNGRVMQRLPIWGLAPRSANEFILAVRAYAIQLGVPPGTSVWLLSGTGAIGGGGQGARAAYRQWMRKLGGFDGTHVPRRCSLSWLAVRIYCVRHPKFVKKGILPAAVTQSIVFSQDALDRLSKLILSPETDAVEIIRRIATWTSREQFFATYCRAFHYLLMAEYAAQQQQGQRRQA